MKLKLIAVLLVLLLLILPSCKARLEVMEDEPSQSVPVEPEPDPVEEPADPGPEEEPAPEEDPDEEESQEDPAPDAQESSAVETQNEAPPETSRSGEEQAAQPAAEPTIEPAVQTTPQVDLEAVATSFRYTTDNVAGIYAWNVRDYTYSPVDPSRYGQVLSLLHAAGSNEAEEMYVPMDGGLHIRLADGTKYNYDLVTNAVRFGTEAYALSESDYRTLLSIANESIANGPAYIQWLAYMTPSRVTSITYHTGAAADPVSIPQANVATAAAALSRIQTVPGSGNAYSGEKSYEKATGNSIIQLNFGGGISYSISLEKENMLYIYSSDMAYGCYYQLETSHATIIATLKSYA